jgi:hypothetical protein
LRVNITYTLKKPSRHIQPVNSRDDIQLEWSSWLDFNSNSIDKVPESEGVYKLHANMKILFIGNSKNLKRSLIQDLPNPCFNNNARFSYAITETADKVILTLLDEYRNKHDGKLPLCMQQ